MELTLIPLKTWSRKSSMAVFPPVRVTWMVGWPVPWAGHPWRGYFFLRLAAQE